jgi:hypothetical protein
MFDALLPKLAANGDYSIAQAWNRQAIARKN